MAHPEPIQLLSIVVWLIAVISSDLKDFAGEAEPLPLKGDNDAEGGQDPGVAQDRIRKRSESILAGAVSLWDKGWSSLTPNLGSSQSALSSSHNLNGIVEGR